MKIYNYLKLPIIAISITLYSVLLFSADKPEQKPKSEINPTPIEKEKVDFGNMINQSNKEMNTAEKVLDNSIRPSKVNLKKYNGKTEKIKLETDPGQVETQDNIHWDYNKKNAQQHLEKNQKNETQVLDEESHSN